MYNMNPQVTVVLLNWNGWKDTIECLESLYQIDYPNYDIILVDNDSDDDSIERDQQLTVKPKSNQNPIFTVINLITNQFRYSSLIKMKLKLEKLLNQTTTLFHRTRD